MKMRNALCTKQFIRQAITSIMVARAIAVVVALLVTAIIIALMLTTVVVALILVAVVVALVVIIVVISMVLMALVVPMVLVQQPTATGGMDLSICLGITPVTGGPSFCIHLIIAMVAIVCIWHSTIISLMSL